MRVLLKIIIILFVSLLFFQKESLLWCERTPHGPLPFKCKWYINGIVHAAIPREELRFKDPSSSNGEIVINDQCKITLVNWSSLDTASKFKIMMQYYNNFNQIFDFIEKYCQEKK